MPVLVAESMRLIPKTRLLIYRGAHLKLRPKEYELMEFLFWNKNRIVSRSALLEYVWNYDPGVDTNTLEMHITALRKKTEVLFEQNMIETIYGIGYRLSV